MYSIKFVLSKIDDVYQDKIKTFTFTYYKHSLYQLAKDDIQIFKNIKHMCKDAFCLRQCDKKKIIKIPKNKLSSPLSSSEIFKHILNKLNIDDYNITINLRKVYPEYNEQLGMLSSMSEIINKNDNIHNLLQNMSRQTMEENVLKKYHFKPCITSLLNMKVASFIDEKKVVTDICSIKYYKEFITILPVNTDEKYIIAIYVY
jgi:ubiquinone biosynthesis protein Coq4